MLEAYAASCLALAVLVGVWLAVQSAWRRTFLGGDPEADALAGRGGCGCATPDRCTAASAEAPGCARHEPPLRGLAPRASAAPTPTERA